MGIQKSLSVPLSRSDLKRYVGSVRVYGDDLIVPIESVHTVVNLLEHFGAQVGADKSFWTGKFRESCGREYFNGHDVSITRVRQAFPARRQDVTEVESLVSLRNQLYMSGYWRTVKWLDGLLGKLLTHFPTIGPSSSLLGRVSLLTLQTRNVFDEHRLCPRLHIPLVKGYLVKAKPPRDNLDGTGALLKCLLKSDLDGSLRMKNSCYPSDTLSIYAQDPLEEKSPMVSGNHLERSGRPKSSSMKLGWRSPL